MRMQNFSFDNSPNLTALLVGEKEKYGHLQGSVITTYYVILMLVGIPGNVLTCLIIKANAYMRTPPNYYLANLAAVDLITLVSGKSVMQNNMNGKVHKYIKR